MLKDGTAGFGFSLDLDATVARDMAAWDAHAKSAGKPLWRMLGYNAPLLGESGPPIEMTIH